MSSVATTTRSSITLKGSAELVREFFYFGINSILYQRGLYPADSFKREKKYGLSLLVTDDEKLNAFLNPLLEQMKVWLIKKQLRRLVVVLSTVDDKEVVERWQFDIETDENITEEGPNSAMEKPEKKIRQEIQDVIRQIVASVTFLPLLERQCSFDVLIYTGKASEAPSGWALSDPCIIRDSQQVQLKSFSTAVHRVDAKVSYKNE